MPLTARFTADRRGFTLVEILVVIALIGTLVALLLPAVNSAREAGRRTACINNQFQQAFATIRFNDSKRFIPGWRNAVVWTNASMTPTSGTHFVSWPVMILPNMERKDIYNAITTGPNPVTPYLSFFACPSSPPDSTTGPTLAYVGSSGMGSNSAAGRASGVMLDLTATGGMAARLSMDDVAGNDGTATTLLLAEECGRLITNQNSWATQPVPSSNGVLNWLADTTPAFGLVSQIPSNPLKVINNLTVDANGIPRRDISSAANMPNSNHPGGAVVAFCDGHTGYLKDSLQSQVYAQLMSWNHILATGTIPYLNWAGTYPVLQEADFQ